MHLIGPQRMPSNENDTDFSDEMDEEDMIICCTF